MPTTVSEQEPAIDPLSELAIPLTRAQGMTAQGVFMALSTGINSMLGMVTWIIAARAYSAEEVGLASAAVSSMGLLIGIGQLGLPLALPRLLPVAGPHARRLVMLSYLAASTVSLVAGIVFVALFSRAAGLDGFFGQGGWVRIWFVLSVPVCVVFALQDFVLCALRRASWTPVENTAFSVVRALMLLAIPGLGAAGIYLAWTFPAAIAAGICTVLIFGKLLPHRSVDGLAAEEWFRPAAIVRLVSTDYVGGLAQTAAVRLLPLIVVARMGGRESAIFFVAFSLMFAIDVALSSVTAAVSVEGASSSAHMFRTVKATLKRWTGPALLATVGMMVGAPYFLTLFSAEYTEGTTILRILCLSLMPRFVILLGLAVARQARLPRMMLVFQVVPAALVLGLALTFGQTVTAVAWSYTAAEILGSLIAGVWLISWMRAQARSAVAA